MRDSERIAQGLIEIDRALAKRLDALVFGPPVNLVYNPLIYAQSPHEDYLRKFGGIPHRAVFLGMNPGPFGMAQTGVPFGEIAAVRDWMEVSGDVMRPEVEHPKRPILGFDCERSEVSGRRLWGWAKDRFQTAEAFFDRCFVINYCPLIFLEETGRNRTPNKLTREEQRSLDLCCEDALQRKLALLEPSYVIGIGNYAFDKLKNTSNMDAHKILHPSPASPAANRGWQQAAEAQLTKQGIAL